VNFSQRIMNFCGDLAQTTNHLVAELVKEGRLTYTQNGMLEPKILAFLLVCRTLTNFEAVILLAQKGFVVEARAVARCCFENLFLIGGLHEGGVAFAQKMKEDDEAGRRNRLKFAQSTNEIFDTLEPEIQKAVKAALASQSKKADFLSPKTASGMGNFGAAYLAHSQISGDAAHASLTALKRYWNWGKDRLPEFDVRPTTKQAEIDQTLLFTAMAVLGMLGTMDDMVGGLPTGKLLRGVADQLQALQDEEAQRIDAATCAS
jgi:hypothetical protein